MYAELLDGRWEKGETSLPDPGKLPQPQDYSTGARSSPGAPRERRVPRLETVLIKFFSGASFARQSCYGFEVSMKITKVGHCCLLIEEGELRILTDPGSYCALPRNFSGVDVILITHEHNDHYYVPSLREVLIQNRGAAVFTNKAVITLMEKEGLHAELFEEGMERRFKGVTIAAYGKEHAVIWKEIATVVNTGFFIADRLFYPGDSLTVPPIDVEILALPVAGPWLKISEAIEYAIEVKPHLCFPVHDGGIKILSPFHTLPRNVLEKRGITFTPLEADGVLKCSDIGLK